MGSVFLVWISCDCWLITVPGYLPFKVLQGIDAQTGLQ